MNLTRLVLLALVAGPDGCSAVDGRADPGASVVGVANAVERQQRFDVEWVGRGDGDRFRVLEEPLPIPGAPGCGIRPAEVGDRHPGPIPDLDSARRDRRLPLCLPGTFSGLEGFENEEDGETRSLPTDAAGVSVDDSPGWGLPRSTAGLDPQASGGGPSRREFPLRC